VHLPELACSPAARAASAAGMAFWWNGSALSFQTIFTVPG